MTPSAFRIIGILFLVAAVVAAILNLHRVADLGMPWLAPLLLLAVQLSSFCRSVAENRRYMSARRYPSNGIQAMRRIRVSLGRTW